MSDKKEALALFHRAQMMAAAKTLFLEKGIEAATVDEIAKRAGYSKSTVYVYFASKEDVYDHIVCESMVQLKHAIERSMAGAQRFMERYFSCCRAVAGVYEECPLFFESLTGKIAVSDEAFQKAPVLREIYRVGEEINAALQRLIESGKAEDVLLSQADPLPTAFLLWASLCGLLRMAHTKEDYYTKRMGLTREAFLEQGYSMLLRAISA